MKQIGFKIGEQFESGNLVKSIPDVDFQHVLIEGATGSGKTASMILPTLDDRIQRKHAILFFDHKGHEHQKVKYLAKKAGRLGDVVEIGKPHASYLNLMAELDTIRLKEMAKSQGVLSDTYWSNSASNLLEDIVIPLRRVHEIVHTLKGYRLFDSSVPGILNELIEFGIDIYKKPSFRTLSTITASPKKLTEYKNILSSILFEFERLLGDNKNKSLEIADRRQILAKILLLNNSTQLSSRFTLSDKESDANSGNNGVLQHLDNTLAAYAKKDYINTDEYTISGLMNDNAIIIIDTQSFGDDIMKVFLESILKKAVMRLRLGTNQPMSVFIDEANRVLFPSIDLHNDVLREASVELILAIQNEEQMVNKFTKTVWDSIRENIKHKYFIDLEHTITYRECSDLIRVEPMRFEADALMEAEYAYSALEKNQTNIKKYFLSTIDPLPQEFTVVYDLDRFENESSIYLEDRYGMRYLLSYYGEDIIKQIKKTFPEVILDYEEDEPVNRKFEFEMYPSKEYYHFDGLFDAPYFDEEEDRSMDDDEEDDSWNSYEDEDIIEF